MAGPKNEPARDPAQGHAQARESRGSGDCPNEAMSVCLPPDLGKKSWWQMERAEHSPSTLAPREQLRGGSQPHSPSG